MSQAPLSLEHLVTDANEVLILFVKHVSLNKDLLCLAKQFKRVVEKVAKVKKDEIRGGGDHHLELVPFPIPSLPPTMKSCSCIKISYELKVLKFINCVHLLITSSTKLVSKGLI